MTTFFEYIIYVLSEMLKGLTMIPIIICLITFYICYLILYIYPITAYEAFKFVFLGKPSPRFQAYREKSKKGLVRFNESKSIVKPQRSYKEIKREK